MLLLQTTLDEALEAANTAKDLVLKERQEVAVLVKARDAAIIVSPYGTVVLALSWGVCKLVITRSLVKSPVSNQNGISSHGQAYLKLLEPMFRAALQT